MKILNILMLAALWISLSACQTINHNLIPHDGPTMEAVYDGMNKTAQNVDSQKNELTTLRKTLKNRPNKKSDLSLNVPSHDLAKEFHKVENPEVKIYFYPHLAGEEELPVPGYYTMISLYTRDHYVLNSTHE